MAWRIVIVLVANGPFVKPVKDFLDDIVFVVVFDHPADLTQRKIINPLHTFRIVQILLKIVEIIIRNFLDSRLFGLDFVFNLRVRHRAKLRKN